MDRPVLSPPFLPLWKNKAIFFNFAIKFGISYLHSQNEIVLMGPSISVTTRSCKESCLQSKEVGEWLELRFIKKVWIRCDEWARTSMDFMTPYESYELFYFQNHQIFKKFDTVPLLNSFCHLERNKNPTNTYDSKAFCISATTGSLECEDEIQASTLNYFLPMCIVFSALKLLSCMGKTKVGLLSDRPRRTWHIKLSADVVQKVCSLNKPLNHRLIKGL